MVSSLIFQKISEEGLTEPPPQNPSLFFLGLRLWFGFRPQFSSASRPRLELHPRLSFTLDSRLSPRPPIKFQSPTKLLFSSYQSLSMDFMWMWACLRTNSVVYLKCLLKICTKKACIRLLHQLHQLKKLKLLRGLRPPGPLSSHQIITNKFSLMWAIELFCWLFRIITSNKHQKFLRRGSPSHLPRTLPLFFLDLRLRFGFLPQFSSALRPQLELHPRLSFTLDSLVLRPRFRLRPQLSIKRLSWSQRKILEVVSSIPDRVGYISHVHWPNDCLGPFRELSTSLGTQLVGRKPHFCPPGFKRSFGLSIQGHFALVLSICVICLTGVSGFARRPPPAIRYVCFYAYNY